MIEEIVKLNNFTKTHLIQTDNVQAKKKVVCLMSPDRPYFNLPTLALFLGLGK